MVKISILCLMVALSMGAVTAAQQADDAQVRARQRISMMEGTLERAVKIGADNLLHRVRAMAQDPPRLSGVPEVRGFFLDGYGIFFDVEVPALRLPVTWPLRYMTRDRNLDTVLSEFRALSAQANRMDPEFQQRFTQAVRRLEAQTTQGPQTMRGPIGTVSSTQLGVTPESVRTPTIDPRLLDNPNAGYTSAVKEALIDAMIENSGSLTLGPDEWLTVAARDNLPRDPLMPGDTVDFSTVIFKMKGSDLTAFRSGRLTIEEARQKVDVREY